jgi:2-(1,2-epoxy-1,2-dihydrophenyl)acetyl-CoA isomerase
MTGESGSTVYNTITSSVSEGIATVTMDRPDSHNAMTLEMVVEVYQALREIESREDVRIVVLTGAGRIFCPGGDIDAIAEGAASDPAEMGQGLEVYKVPALLHDMPQVTVAAINGSCAGAALGWACGCDLRYTVETAKFTTAFLPLGIAGDMALPWSLPRIVGAGRARELSFFADVFTAPDAHRIGLVSDVFTRDEFAERMDGIVRRLAAAKPEALRRLKEHYVQAETMSFGDFAVHEADWHVKNFSTEGFEKFLANREARRQA